MRIALTINAGTLHTSPLLIGFSYLSYLTPLNAPEWFSLFMAIGVALMAFCFARAAADFMRFHCPKLAGGKYQFALFVIAAGIIFALNPITANILAYPHFEIYIPAFALWFLLSLANDRRKTALFGAGVIVVCARRCRFSFGGGVVGGGGIFVFGTNARRHKVIRRTGASSAFVVVECSGVYRQRDSHNLFREREVPFFIFDNSPDITEIGNRVRAIAWRLEYTSMFLFIPAAALFCRRWDWMIGLLSVVPWLIFSLFSQSYGAYLEAYYAFPLILALFWPLVSHRYALSQRHAPSATTGKKIKRPRPQLAALFLLLFVGITFIRPLEIQSTIRSALKPFLQAAISPPSPKRVAAVRALGEFYKQNRRRIISDDTFASLYPHDVPAVKELGLNSDRILACGGDIMIINQAHFGLLADMLYAATHHFRLQHWYGLLDTEYLLASAAPLCENGRCQNNLPLAQVDLSGWLAQTGQRGE